MYMYHKDLLYDIDRFGQIKMDDHYYLYDENQIKIDEVRADQVYYHIVLLNQQHNVGYWEFYRGLNHENECEYVHQVNQ